MRPSSRILYCGHCTLYSHLVLSVVWLQIVQPTSGIIEHHIIILRTWLTWYENNIKFNYNDCHPFVRNIFADGSNLAVTCLLFMWDKRSQDRIPPRKVVLITKTTMIQSLGTDCTPYCSAQVDLSFHPLCDGKMSTSFRPNDNNKWW